MAKYRKKSIIVEAWKWDGSEEMAIQLIQDNILKGSVQKVLEGETPTVAFRIFTLEGAMSVSKGDYLIKGIENELDLCKPDIFKKTYEEVGISIEEIDAALAEHNLHEEWIEMEDKWNARMDIVAQNGATGLPYDEDNLKALKEILRRESEDTREEE